jgi:hypothetical protein
VWRGLLWTAIVGIVCAGLQRMIILVIIKQAAENSLTGQTITS